MILYWPFCFRKRQSLTFVIWSVTVQRPLSLMISTRLFYYCNLVNLVVCQDVHRITLSMVLVNVVIILLFHPISWYFTDTISTLVPIQNNNRKSLKVSDNYRAIALSSILGKVLDNLILVKYHDVFSTCDMQFGFKTSHNTTQCTFVVNKVNCSILPK